MGTRTLGHGRGARERAGCGAGRAWWKSESTHVRCTVSPTRTGCSLLPELPITRERPKAAKQTIRRLGLQVQNLLPLSKILLAPAEHIHRRALVFGSARVAVCGIAKRSFAHGTNDADAGSVSAQR